jgi:hypothetical protein
MKLLKTGKMVMRRALAQRTESPLSSILSISLYFPRKGVIMMKSKTAIVFGVAVLIGSLATAFFASHPATAEPTPERAASGRYQLHIRDRIDVEAGRSTVAGNSLVVVDTATGQCWERNGDGKWVDYGNPAKAK